MGSELHYIINKHHPACLESWSGEPTSVDPGRCVLVFQFPLLRLEITLDCFYQQIGACNISDTEGNIRRVDLDSIRADVRYIMGVLFLDCRYVRDMELAIAILQALERIAEYLVPRLQHEKTIKAWNPKDITDWEDIINNPYGLDVSTVEDSARELLDKSLEDIVSDIPDSFRIIHIESVVRADLLGRFKKYRARLKNDLIEDTFSLRQKLSPHSVLNKRVRATIPKEDIVEDMITPRVTFHGTPLKSVHSIVRHGFVLPGRMLNGKVIASPRSGIAFNRGIYSSQSAAYALSYAENQHEMTPLGKLPSLRLFVCATIMGRTCSDPAQGIHGPLLYGYDSHFDGKFEYIVHDEHTMLPCYVIHLDLGSEAAKNAIKATQTDPWAFQSSWETKRSKAKHHPKLNTEELMPGDRKRQAEARKAAAMKWFPYGFGAASGTKFVIEEVGEVSDDEEEYGEWQADKHAFVSTEIEGSFVGDVYQSPKTKDEGSSFFDSYQTHRYCS